MQKPCNLEKHQESSLGNLRAQAIYKKKIQRLKLTRSLRCAPNLYNTETSLFAAAGQKRFLRNACAKRPTRLIGANSFNSFETRRTGWLKLNLSLTAEQPVGQSSHCQKLANGKNQSGQDPETQRPQNA